jgi:hypothetical protein
MMHEAPSHRTIIDAIVSFDHRQAIDAERAGSNPDHDRARLTVLSVPMPTSPTTASWMA